MPAAAHAQVLVKLLDTLMPVVVVESHEERHGRVLTRERPAGAAHLPAELRARATDRTVPAG